MKHGESEYDLVKVRDSTLRELERLLEQRRQIDREISGLRVAVNGLSATIQAQQNRYAFEPTPLDKEYEGIREMGLTDAIRKVFENADSDLSPKDVRDKLRTLGYDKLPADNPLAAIHGIFTRLEKAEEIGPGQSGKNYRWIPPVERGLGLVPDFRQLAGVQNSFLDRPKKK